MSHLLPAWRGRRVLLACGTREPPCAMHILLEEIGARPARVDICCGSETLCRALHAGRGICMIVPELSVLLHLQPAAQLAALATLLSEAREAGTPLVMLLAGRTDAHQEHMLTRLLSYADDFSHGLYGDPVSIQCIRHNGALTRTVCLEALAHGARYLLGDRAYTGILS